MGGKLFVAVSDALPGVAPLEDGAAPRTKCEDVFEPRPHVVSAHSNGGDGVLLQEVIDEIEVFAGILDVRPSAGCIKHAARPVPPLVLVCDEGTDVLLGGSGRNTLKP